MSQDTRFPVTADGSPQESATANFHFSNKIRELQLRVEKGHAKNVITDKLFTSL